MRAVNMYLDDIETLEELNEYRGGNRRASKEQKAKVLNRIGKDSSEDDREERNDKE